VKAANLEKRERLLMGLAGTLAFRGGNTLIREESPHCHPLARRDKKAKSNHERSLHHTHGRMQHSEEYDTSGKTRKADEVSFFTRPPP
jgi:hypothetical protein